MHTCNLLKATCRTVNYFDNRQCCSFWHKVKQVFVHSTMFNFLRQVEQCTIRHAEMIKERGLIANSHRPSRHNTAVELRRVRRCELAISRTAYNYPM